MPNTTRRALLATAPATLIPRWVHAATEATPRASEGPFYPVELPSDHDNDLVLVEGAVRQAGGEILHLNGILRDTAGMPIPNGLIDIWQCDVNGVYLHPGSPGYRNFDQGFQGFGRAAADVDGRFAFRTIVPTVYPGRTPHIHLKAYGGGWELLTTQFYLADHPLNARDGLFNRMSAAEQARQTMTLRPFGAGEGTAQQTEIAVVIGN
ncbi:MAG: protocatechuate 3,4-dioxygenase [Pseudomonadota bacterium]